MAGRKESGYLVMSIEQPEALCRVARALSSPKRIEILRLLGEHNILNVGEIATAIGLPVSSTAMHIVTLEEAGLIACVKQPSLRGAVKMCTREKREIVFHLQEAMAAMPRVLSQHLPLGAYSRAEGITASCGLASHIAPIGAYNNPRSFHLPERLHGEILWFHGGSLTYLFSMLAVEAVTLHWLEISFEVCAQAPVIAPAWRSDMEVAVNGIPLGRGVTTCECHGRRGLLNPDWWPDVATQFGKLATWRVDDVGTTLDGEKVGDTRIDDLRLWEGEAIAVTIKAPDEDGNQPGINLFGNQFGDYNQGIALQIGYSLRDG